MLEAACCYWKAQTGCVASSTWWDQTSSTTTGRQSTRSSDLRHIERANTSLSCFNLFKPHGCEIISHQNRWHTVNKTVFLLCLGIMNSCLHSEIRGRIAPCYTTKTFLLCSVQKPSTYCKVQQKTKRKWPWPLLFLGFILCIVPKNLQNGHSKKCGKYSHGCNVYGDLHEISLEWEKIFGNFAHTHKKQNKKRSA